MTNEERIRELLNTAQALETEVDHLLNQLNVKNHVNAKGAIDPRLDFKLSLLEITLNQTLTRYTYLKSTTP